VGVIHDILFTFFPPRPTALTDVLIGRIALVRGIVAPRDLLQSPLTGEQCVYYQYTVENWHESNNPGPNTGYWMITEHDEAIAEFYLQQDSTRAIVAPHRANVERGPRVKPHRVELGMSYRRAQQLLIRPGDEVEVMAIAHEAEDLFDDGRDYHQQPHRLILHAPHTEMIRIRLLHTACQE